MQSSSERHFAKIKKTAPIQNKVRETRIFPTMSSQFCAIRKLAVNEYAIETPVASALFIIIIIAGMPLTGA